MPDTCTVQANIITCVTEFDWAQVMVTALVPAIIGVMAAVLATGIANRHQRGEASKQRKIVATAAIMRSAHNMVRSSHRNKEAMRDHASEFEIAIRILSVELQTSAGRAFVDELKAWRRAIAADCRSLEVLPPEQDHDTKPINEVRSKKDAFVEYLDEWLHLNERQLAGMVEEMSAAAARLWPHINPEDRKLPRLGANP
jgi:membrane glycosyltransferase